MNIFLFQLFKNGDDGLSAIEDDVEDKCECQRDMNFWIVFEPIRRARKKAFFLLFFFLPVLEFSDLALQVVERDRAIFARRRLRHFLRFLDF